MEHRMRAVADGGFGRWVPDRAARPKRGLLVWLACVLLIQTIAFVRHHGPATADRSTAMCLRR
jgi:hypothetical protein